MNEFVCFCFFFFFITFFFFLFFFCSFFFFQAEDGIRDFCLSRGLGDVYKRQEGSAGRTDFYSGDYIAQRNSLARIAALREDYLIYPGHGSSTTLKQEKKFNQFLGQSPVDFF